MATVLLAHVSDPLLRANFRNLTAKVALYLADYQRAASTAADLMSEARTSGVDFVVDEAEPDATVIDHRKDEQREAHIARLETDAVCTLDQTDAGFRITSMRLSVRGQVDGIDEEGFRAAAEEAKAGCPVSNALGDVETSIEASLEGGS